MDQKEFGPKTQLEQIIFETKLQINVLSRFPELVYIYAPEDQITEETAYLNGKLMALTTLHGLVANIRQRQTPPNHLLSFEPLVS